MKKEFLTRYCLRTEDGYVKFDGSGGHTTVTIVKNPHEACYREMAEDWEQGYVHNLEHALEFYAVPWAVVEKVYFRNEEEADEGT